VAVDAIGTSEDPRLPHDNPTSPLLGAHA